MHLVAVDWHCRHAALMAISAVGEGCEKEMIPILADVVNAILPFCHDQVRCCLTDGGGGGEGERGGYGGMQQRTERLAIQLTAP